MTDHSMPSVRTFGAEPEKSALDVRTLCMTVLFMIASTPALADCPAPPIGNANDMVVSFMATHGTQNAPASIMPSTVKEGMLVYDSTADTLKLCDGTNWHPISMGTASDPRIGTLNAGKWCASDGSIIHCTADAPATVVGSDKQVIFNDGNTTLAGAAQLFWDKVNNRVGIGVDAPMSRLQIGGDATGINGFRPTVTIIADGVNDGGTALRLRGSVAGGNVLGIHGLDNVATFFVNEDGRVFSGVSASPDPSAQLHVQSTTRGFLPPRMAAAQRDAIVDPAAGLLVYNTDDHALNYWNGTVWGAIGSSALAAGSTGQIQFNGGSGTFAADAGLHWDNINKRLGIGTDNPAREDPLSKLTVVGDGQYGQITAISYNPQGSNGGENAGVIKVFGSRGTAASPVMLSNGDRFGLILAQGYDGSKFNASASMEFRVDGPTTAGDLPSSITFYTKALGDTSRSQRLHITSNGSIGIGTFTPTARLHVYGDSPRFRIQDNDDADSFFEIHDPQPTQTVIRKRTTSGANMIDISPIPEDGTSTAYVRLLREANTTGTRGLLIHRGDGTATSDHQFLSGTSGPLALLAIHGGNVGIGTSSPSAPLHVSKTASGATEDIAIFSNSAAGISGSAARIYLSASGSAFRSVYLEGVNTGGNNNAHSLAFGVSSPSLPPTERMRITQDGNVGINTAAPAAKLHVEASGEAIRLTSPSHGSLYMGMDANHPWIGTRTDHNLRLATNQATRMTITNTGLVGIGTTTPRTPLHVMGSAGTGKYYPGSIVVENGIPSITLADTDGETWLDHNNSGNRSWWLWNGSEWSQRMYLTPTGALWIYGTLTQNSDARLKENIAPLENALARIAGLSGVSYEWKDSAAMKGRQLGVIAQNVAQIYPEAVTTGADGMMSVDYSALIAPIIEALKELKAENDALRREFETYRTARP